MLYLLIFHYGKMIGAREKKLTLGRKAANKVCDFLKGKGSGRFPNLDRDRIATNITMTPP